MIKVIPLGKCCRISYNLEKLKLKEETSVFEWMLSDNFTDILDIIEHMMDNQYINIYHKNDNDYLNDTDIHTRHYVRMENNIIKSKLPEIFTRRANRFFHSVIDSDQIIFVREDASDNVTLKDIERFDILIKRINSQCDYKLLLLTETNNFNEIIHPHLNHRKYDEILYHDYIYECFNIYPTYSRLKVGDTESYI